MEHLTSIEILQPNIMQYTHVYKYFEDYFNYRKAIDDKFSFEVWAAELGFKSRSYIHMLIKGKKKVTQAFIDIFSRKLNLNDKEISHLTALSFYRNSKSLQLKNFFNDKILETLDDPENITEVKNNAKFLSSRHLPLLRMILSYKDFQATESSLKKLLAINATELKKNLKILEELELIRAIHVESSEEKIWISNTKSFKSTNKNQENVFKNYHLETLQEAESVLHADEILRKFKSIYFSLDEESFPSLSEDVDAFVRKMKLKYESATLNKKHVFKLNVQAYPLTKKYLK